jgi:hypothetical protein
MNYIDPHIHMISRVTDDYHRMAQCGCEAVSEPAFWAGFDRGSAEGFRDYFHHLTEVEPKRAAQFGIRHYSWLCINAKEAENVSLSRDVIALRGGARGQGGAGTVHTTLSTTSRCVRLFRMAVWRSGRVRRLFHARDAGMKGAGYYDQNRKSDSKRGDRVSKEAFEPRVPATATKLRGLLCRLGDGRHREPVDDHRHEGDLQGDPGAKQDAVDERSSAVVHHIHLVVEPLLLEL